MAVPAVVVTVGVVGWLAVRYGLGVDSRQHDGSRSLLIALLGVVSAAVLVALVVVAVRGARPVAARVQGRTRALLVLSTAAVLAIAGLGTVLETGSIEGEIPAHFRGEAGPSQITVMWDGNRWATAEYEIEVDSDLARDMRPVQGTTFSMPADGRPHTFWVVSMRGQRNSFTSQLSCPALGACVPVANPYVTGGD